VNVNNRERGGEVCKCDMEWYGESRRNLPLLDRVMLAASFQLARRVQDSTFR
jgi:hypothetical protein